MAQRRYPRFDELRPSSEKASFCKEHTPSKDTTPERLLRRALFREGLRFRTNSKVVPGKPDLVFVRPKVAVFVDGDFWHGKDWRKRRLRLLNGSNKAYWIAKIEANIRRDRQVSKTLIRAGWTVLRFWESEVCSSLDSVSRKVSEVIKKDFLT